MLIVRLIVTFAIGGGLAFYLGRVVIAGLMSGQVRHSDSSSVCRKSHNPIGYWLLIVLFSLIAVGGVVVVGKVAYETVAH